MNRRSVILSVIAAGLAAACSRAPDSAGDAPVVVLAAASLTDALTAVGEAWTRETGREVQFSFASSSTLARQIEAGAPADLFAFADAQWMNYLAERGLIDASSRVAPIGNSLVLIAPADSPLQTLTIDASLNLTRLLGRDGRMAAGDPDHVPAGLYARRALESLGLWEEAEPRLARAEDVRAALALVARGEAPLGVVYATDAAISDDVKVVGRFPANSHPPILYPFALIGPDHSPAAQSFFSFATGNRSAAIYAQYGFAAR